MNDLSDLTSGYNLGEDVSTSSLGITSPSSPSAFPPLGRSDFGTLDPPQSMVLGETSLGPPKNPPMTTMPRKTLEKTWSQFKKSTRISIIVGSVIGAIVIGVAITLAVIFTRKKSGSGSNPNKYKCVVDKNNDTHCIEDHTHGTSTTKDCCHFACGSQGCVFSEEGTYTDPLTCITNCNQATSFYGCINGSCVPTTAASQLFNNICCGAASCNQACNGGGDNKLIERSSGSFQNPETSRYKNFGALVSVNAVTAESGKAVAVTSALDLDQNRSALLVYEGERVGTSFVWGSTNLFVSNSAVNFYQGAINKVYTGQEGQAVGANFNSKDNTVTSGFLGLLNNTWKQNIGSGFALQGSTNFQYTANLAPTVKWGVYTLDNKLGAVTDDAKAGVETTVEGLETNFPSLVITEPVSNKIMAVVAISTGSLYVAVFDTSERKWTSVRVNPLADKTVPVGVLAFGKRIAMSHDGKVMLVMSDKRVFLYEVQNPSKAPESWIWEEKASTQPVTLMTNVAVSPSGNILAWASTPDTPSAPSRAVVTQRKTDEKGGFSDSIILVTDGSEKRFGTGGLSVNDMGNQVYLITAATGTGDSAGSSAEQILYWTVEDTS